MAFNRPSPALTAAVTILAIVAAVFASPGGARAQAAGPGTPALQATPVAQAPAPAAPTGVHYIYLIRHGHYDRSDDVDDTIGNGLNPLGHEQAELTGRRLAGLPVTPASLVSSDYTRARETADDIGRVLGRTAERDSLLRECLPFSDRPDLMKDEDPAEVAACDSTLSLAWARYVTPSPDADRHDVLVCHGNVIRWFVTRALGADTKRWATMDIGNASLTIIAVRPDGTTRLVMYSDVGHIPLDKQSWIGRGAGWSRAPR